MTNLSHKTIVLCSDGTGNSAIKGRGTNVFKLYEALDIQGHKSDPTQARQIAFYDDGVGVSSNPIKKLLGDAFGYGFSENIRSLYIQLVRAYESKEDRIFLFGFSRGAFTIRALSGMVQKLGILQSAQFLNKDDLEKAVALCWVEFSNYLFEGKAINKALLKDLIFFDTIEIDFIGVWDTVGAVGTPFYEIIDILNKSNSFYSQKPGRVKRACQALSIDDQRMTFRPELWDETDAKPEQIEQVWFAGVHSNVGGGYPKQGMSLVALDWMMAQAEKSGLRFITAARDYVSTEQDVHGELYNSRSGLGVYYRWQPRNIFKLCQDRHITTPKIHVSVYERIAQSTADYAPGNIPFCSQVVSHNNWPSSLPLINIQTEIAKAGAPFPNQHSLIDSVSSTLCSGKAAYYTFLMATLFALIALIFNPFQSWCLSLIVIAITVFIMATLIWTWTSRIDHKLTLVYTSFWSGRLAINTSSLRKRLRSFGL